MTLFGLGVALGTFAGAAAALLLNEWLTTPWPA
jgi:hypothetical protein